MTVSGLQFAIVICRLQVANQFNNATDYTQLCFEVLSASSLKRSIILSLTMTPFYFIFLTLSYEASFCQAILFNTGIESHTHHRHL